MALIITILNSEAIIGSEDSENTLRIITIDDIQKDSKSWGNYLNSIGGAKINSGNGVMAGGTNEYWKANNIYDLAGNAREWTQEKYFTGTNRAARGGGYSDNANSSPESSRGNNTEDYISVGRRI